MKFKKICSLIIASTMLISTGSIVGCGKKSESASNGKSDDKIELKLWLTPQWKGVQGPNEKGADYDSFFKYAAKEFNKKNPNIKLDVQVIPAEQRSDKLNVAIQTKTLPDMFFDSTFALTEFAHKGVVVPLDDIIDDKAKEDIPEQVWDNVKIGKGTYFYPFSQMPGTLAYNADMLKSAGLDNYIGGENEIKTWSLEDFQKILKTLKSSNKDIAPMSLFAKNTQGDTWNLAYLRMFGSKFFNEKGEIVVNDEEGIKALTFLNDLYKKGLTTTGVESLSSNDCNAMFLNKKVAISFTNSVLFNNAKSDMKDGKTEKFDMRLANIPGEKEPLSFTYVTGACVFDTGDKARINATKKFVKFFSSDPELVKASKNGVPVRKSVTEAVKGELPYLEAYEKNSKYIFNFSNNTPGYLELRNLLFPELQAVFTGSKNPKQALDDYTKKGNEVIKKNKEESAILGSEK